MKGLRIHAMAVGLLAALACPAAGGDVEVTSSADLKEVARRAAPGTRILLPPGTYRGPCKITGVRGEPGRLVHIAAKDPARPPVFTGGDVAFQLINCRYVMVDRIVAEKGRVNNLQVGNKSHHVILKDVIARDIAAQSNNDGMKLPDLTDFLVYRCTVAHWGGEGSAVDMVGCARGLFMRCTFTYPKPKGVTANCIQPKGGTFNVGVYRCRFDDASFRAMQFGGSTGQRYFFRGNRQQGYEGYDLVAMGNVITRGGAAAAFVSCTNCTLAYNTVVDPTKYVARILKEGGTKPTGNNRFTRNLIVHGKLAEVLNHGPQVDLKSHAFRENYWYNRLEAAASVPKLPVTQIAPAGGKDPRLDGQLRPAKDGPAAAYGAHAAGLDKAWGEHVKKFDWAWKHARRFEHEKK